MDGCGKYTNVLVVQGDKFRGINQRVINEIDELYGVWASEIQPSLFIDCCGEEPFKAPSMTLPDLKGRIGALIQTLRDETPDYVKQWRQKQLARLTEKLDQQSPTRDSSGQPA